MNSTSEENWDRARRARDRLAAKLLSHPEVSMVDVGLGDDPNSLALRVHVRTDAASLPRIPAELDGIPVQVVRGDYRPE